MKPARQASTHHVPRLLSLEDTAAYLSVSPWTVRELEWSGVLPLQLLRARQHPGGTPPAR